MVDGVSTKVGVIMAEEAGGNEAEARLLVDEHSDDAPKALG